MSKETEEELIQTEIHNQKLFEEWIDRTPKLGKQKQTDEENIALEIETQKEIEEWTKTKPQTQLNS